MIKQYDIVFLKDGRRGTVVEIFGDHELYLVDIDLPGPDWITIDVKPEEIYHGPIIPDYTIEETKDILLKSGVSKDNVSEVASRIVKHLLRVDNQSER